MKKNFGILIVEDEETLHELFHKLYISIFPEYNVKIFITKSGIKALKILKENYKTIRLVTTDLNHLELNGLLMSKIIKIFYPNIKIILLTGMGGDKIKSECEEVVDVFFHKPVSIDEIKNAVKSLPIFDK